MAYTAVADIIDPEVLSDQIAAKYPDYLVLGNSNLVEVNGTVQLGSAGSRFKMPFWKRIAPFQTLTAGTALVPGKITADAEYAIVQRAGTALAVLDTAELVSEADPVGEIADQLARGAAEFIDNALVVEMQFTPNTYDQTVNGAGTMDQNTAITAMVAGLGDNYGKVLEGGRLILHSKVYSDLVKTGAIQNQYQSGMNVIATGMIPTLMGLPITISDRVTKTNVSGTMKYQSYIVGPRALALFYQRQVMVEFDRDILLFEDIITSNVHFAPHLYGWDDVSNTQKAEDTKSIHVVNIKSN